MINYFVEIDNEDKKLLKEIALYLNKLGFDYAEKDINHLINYYSPMGKLFESRLRFLNFFLSVLEAYPKIPTLLKDLEKNITFLKEIKEVNFLEKNIRNKWKGSYYNSFVLILTILNILLTLLILIPLGYISAFNTEFKNLNIERFHQKLFNFFYQYFPYFILISLTFIFFIIVLLFILPGILQLILGRYFRERAINEEISWNILIKHILSK